MIDKVKKIQENKKLQFIGNLLYILLFLIVVAMLVVVIIQRASNNSIAIGGVRMFSVATGSMLPVYEVGDILVAKEVKPQDIKVGDDIVYKGRKGSFAGKVITHRVIEVEKQVDGVYTIVTKGLANTEQDPEIKDEQVYGKVIYKIQTLSWIGKLVTNIYVFYFVIFVPIGLITYKILKNIFEKDDEDEDEDKKEEN